MEIIVSVGQKEKRLKKSEQSLRDPWDNSKWTDMCTVEVPEGGERGKGGQKGHLKK